MRSLIRQHRTFFVLFSLLAVAMRLFFVYFFPHYAGDSLLYVDIAQNWLHHGSYALTENGIAVPTLIRLPGYPALLALLFKVLGATPEKLLPVLLVQTFVDVGGCFVVSALALTLFGERTARLTFALAALCPFTANYVALPLTETLAIFFSGLALLLAAKAASRMERNSPSLSYWAACGLALGAGVLLRPDGGILLAVMLLYLRGEWVSTKNRKTALVAALVISILALAPLAPWAIRNWHTFHVFQPLAPRYANAPGEYVPMGFNRWIKTWLVEYVSVEDVFWNVSTETPGDTVHIESLPERAFDTPQEREQVAKLLADFNQTLMLSPETDTAFAELARERIRRAPFRYYIELPALRATDMWLRPRTEMLPIDQHWWTFDDPPESWFALGCGTLNLFLVAAGIIGLVRFRGMEISGLFAAFILLRSLFLSSMENPEPRYTLECFPVILVMTAALFAVRRGSQNRAQAG